MSVAYPSFPRNALQPATKRAYKVDDGVFIKHGTGYEVQREVDAIEFVRSYTSIPVPSIIESHALNDEGWFSMKILPGVPLTDAWTSMIEDAQRTTQQDLYKYINMLRAIPPPESAYIGSCNSGPAFDHRLNNGLPCGPFSSESDFNDFLVVPITRNPRKELVAYYRQQLADNHEIVFAHADLCGDHILVEPTTGKITGIIDWEMAGWWPAYWEYTKSLFGNRYKPWWKKLVSEVLYPYAHELRIEGDLQQF
jgi:aminoglycoside phosphotransferase